MSAIDTKQLAADIARVMELDAKRLPYDWRYDPLGLFVVAGKGKNYSRIADVRGWGHLTGGAALNLSPKEAEIIQDATGEFIAASPLMIDIIRRQQEVIKELVKALEKEHWVSNDVEKALVLAASLIANVEEERLDASKATN